MGGGESKESPSATQQINNIIETAFTNASKNKILSRQQFNQSLRLFQQFNGLNICNTHMASRLYEVLVSLMVKLDKDELIDKFKKFVEDHEKCMRCNEICKVDSFRAYDADNDNRISRRDFLDFFEKSWVTQVQIVLDKLKNLQDVRIQDLSIWAKDRRQDILLVATQIFNSLDSQKTNVSVYLTQYLEYKDFQKWIASKQYDLLIFKYQDVIIKFPLHIQAMITVG